MKSKLKMSRQECNDCGSKLVYIRIKTGELVCRSCGKIEKLTE